MSELNDLNAAEREHLLEEARSSLARRRPGFGVLSLAIGLGIPGATVVILMSVAPRFFTSSIGHGLLFVLAVAVSTGIAVTVSSRYRDTAIEREARRMLNDVAGQ